MLKKLGYVVVIIVIVVCVVSLFKMKVDAVDSCVRGGNSYDYCVRGL